MQLLNSNILCVRPQEDNKKGEIILGELDRKTHELIVVQADERIVDDYDIDTGDVLLLPINAGTPTNINGKDYVVVNVNQVILVK